MSDPNYYEVLTVSPHASAEVIKAAYRALSKTMHPDAGGSNELATAINEAYGVLSEPTQRAHHNLELRIGKAKTSELNYYEVLMVSPHASPEVIKAAHRALSKTVAPDTINEAYGILSEPTQRARYDLELRIGKAKTFATGSTTKERGSAARKERGAEALIVCLWCGFKNRIQDASLVERAKCGVCGNSFKAPNERERPKTQAGDERPSPTQDDQPPPIQQDVNPVLLGAIFLVTVLSFPLWLIMSALRM